MNNLCNIPIYAHIFNRGVDKRDIFNDIKDRERFMLIMRIVLLSKSEQVSTILRKRQILSITSIKQLHLNELYGPPLLDILAFCLMPNHFHIIVKSQSFEYISKYAQKLGNSYTRYYDTKNKRSGHLFESRYKIVPIISNEQLIHSVRYVHTNPSNSSRLSLNSKQLRLYKWSSLPAYLQGTSKMCNIREILQFYPSVDDFWEFTKYGIKTTEPIDPTILIDTAEES